MTQQKPSPEKQAQTKKPKAEKTEKAEKEIGGFEDAGLEEPTRFGDWEVKGRCSDF